MVILPVIHSPFQAKFAGPYKVLSQEGQDNYVVATPDKKRNTQLCHANLLKPYFDRGRVAGKDGVSAANDYTELSPVLSPLVAASGEDSAKCSNCLITSVSSPPAVAALDGVDVCEPTDEVLVGRLKNSESLANLPLLLNHLTPEHASELAALIKEFPTLFSDTPTQTHVVSHDIDVGDASPIRQRFYRVSGERQKILETEVQYLLNNDLAQQSLFQLGVAVPCLPVKEADGTYLVLQRLQEMK